MEYRENNIVMHPEEPQRDGSFYNEPKIVEMEENQKYPPIVGEVHQVEEPPKEIENGIHYKLKKPVMFEDVMYEELHLDFNFLTGADVEAALAYVGPSQAMVMEADKKYHAAIAARAAKVPYELFRRLNIADYTAITMEAQSFILGL